MPNSLTLSNPVFVAYAVASLLMVLKAVAMSWLTVAHMMHARGGFRSPEDLRRTPLNRAPNPSQLDPVEVVERVRRILLNDLENLPFFSVAGLIYVTTGPSLRLAQWLFYGHVVSRLLHFAAYYTRQTHDVRATFWTIGSLIIIYMTLTSLIHILR
jgi:glutathione S-transferase